MSHGQPISRSIHWTTERKFKSFYNRREASYNEQRDALFCLYDSRLCVVDRSSSVILAYIGCLGDYITAYSVSRDASIVVTASSSFLFRVYQVDWEIFRKRRAQNINAFGEEGAYRMAFEDSPLAFMLPVQDMLLPIHETRSWKGPQVAANHMTLSHSSMVSPLVAAGFTDGNIYIYDIRTSNCTHVFRQQVTNIGFLKFHPSRLLLFSSSDDGTILVHDLFRHISCVSLKDHRCLPTALDFIIPESNKKGSAESLLGGVVSSSGDKVVNIWNLDSLDDMFSKRLSKTLKDSKRSNPSKLRARLGLPLDQMELEMLNEKMDSASSFTQREKNTIGEKDARRKRQHQTISLESYISQKESEPWYLEKLSQDPIILSPIHQIAVYEGLSSLCCINTHLFSECRIRQCSTEIQDFPSMTPWIIVTAGESGYLSLWNPQTRKKIATVDSPQRENSSIVSLSRHTSPEGAPWLVCSTSDLKIVFWNLRTLNIEKLLIGSSSELIYCQFLNVPYPHYLAYQEHTNISDTKEKKRSSATPFKRSLLLQSDETCVLFEMSLNRANTTLLRGHTDTVLDAASTVDGCWIITGSKDHTIRIWSARLEICVSILDYHTAPVVGVKASKHYKRTSAHQCSCSNTPVTTSSQDSDTYQPKDFFILSVCLDGFLKLCRIKLQDLHQFIETYLKIKPSAVIFDMTQPDKPVDTSQNAEFSPIKIITSEQSVFAHEREINALEISPNNKLAATGSSDKSIKVWGLPTLTLLGVCRGHSRSVVSLQFSPIERVIASGSADQTICLWNLQDFSCLKSFQGHRGSVLSVKFLSLGTRLVTSSNDGQIKVWNIRTCECCHSFDEHNGQKIWSISINDEEDYLLSASADSTLILWKNTTEEFEKNEIEKTRAEAIDLAEIETLTRSGKVLEAVTLSLKRHRIFQTQQIFEESYQNGLFASFDKEYEECTSSSTGASQLLPRNMPQNTSTSLITKERLQKWVIELPETQLKTLIEFIVQLNTTGRTSYLANNLLHYIIKNVPASKLLRLEGIQSLISGFLTYSSRHLNRINALLQRTFILDMIFLMSAGKPFVDVPQLPKRLNDPSESTSSLDPLSLQDTYRIFFE